MLFVQEPQTISLQEAVSQIKFLIETAIMEGGIDKDGNAIDGCEAKNNIIRTQAPICLLHDAVKSSFINLGVNRNYILPPLGQHQGELKVYGFIKAKDQDVCIVPNNIQARPTTLTYNGILRGERDPLGPDYTERILSVNVRSQLSSVAKNFDTLYERTFAEPLNLHIRCPRMVLGEVYMIPVLEYDDDAARHNTVRFKPNPRVRKHIEKYISSFSAVNGRANIEGSEFMYERACLVIVDFSREIPYVYNSDIDLIRDGLLSPDSGISIENLTFESLAPTLLNTYSQRFEEGSFI